MNLYTVVLGNERPNYNHVKSYVVGAATPEDAVYSDAVRVSLYKAVYNDTFDPEFDRPIQQAMHNLGMPLTEAEKAELRTSKTNTFEISQIGITHVTEPTVFCANAYLG